MVVVCHGHDGDYWKKNDLGQYILEHGPNELDHLRNVLHQSPLGRHPTRHGRQSIRRGDISKLPRQGRLVSLLPPLPRRPILLLDQNRIRVRPRVDPLPRPPGHRERYHGVRVRRPNREAQTHPASLSQEDRGGIRRRGIVDHGGCRPPGEEDDRRRRRRRSFEFGSSRGHFGVVREFRFAVRRVSGECHQEGARGEGLWELYTRARWGGRSVRLSGGDGTICVFVFENFPLLRVEILYIYDMWWWGGLVVGCAPELQYPALEADPDG
mmetsp:Transcript_9496/g.20018  ORF Transcript_9496/g.20018 Transcript_9496/m.20018 type:complete len:268 (-) Transcript_9496:184-987(-)